MSIPARSVIAPVAAAVPAKRGRPRRADADGAILGAALELLGDAGVAGLSMDVLAQRAGVGKATIYRRWVSKEALILDALRAANTPVPVPDEGTVRADLVAYADALVERVGDRRWSDVLPHLIEASCYDVQLRQSLDEYLLGRQATIRLILHRGIDRGELTPDTDIDLVVDVILGSFFYRNLLTGARVDQDFAHRLVDLALR
ncbi:MAG: TetR/AcrR family transcriptional regulator [Ilumatobacteraceae bacterium]